MENVNQMSTTIELEDGAACIVWNSDGTTNAFLPDFDDDAEVKYDTPLFWAAGVMFIFGKGENAHKLKEILTAGIYRLLGEEEPE